MLIVGAMMKGTYMSQIEKYDNNIIVRLKNRSVIIAWNENEEITPDICTHRETGCNSNYKTAIGMPFDLGACCRCKYRNLCKYKEDRKKIIDSVENTLDSLKHETPIQFEVICRQFTVDLDS